MPLPSDFLDRLKSANRIDDVMSGYVHLKRTGRNYKCLCPFHSEKTPSCVVYMDSDEHFHCFGCGAGGDVITFIMKIENLDYYEAVKFLAQRGGIEMPVENQLDDRAAKFKNRLYEINKAAARFFYSCLKTEDGREALSYLIQKRRLAPETIKKFGLGAAPNRWTALKNHMLAEGFSEKELLDASLLSQKNGRTFDFFVNRVIFPIFDLRGNVIAFSGRTLDPKSQGMKYLNTRETPLYKKSRTLFAMNLAKNSAIKSKQLILCEGNVDVITLHQAGFDTAVATCGTAITPEHARLMVQYCDEVFICYDADGAGQKATQAAIDILSAAGLKAKVVKIGGENVKDVDDYINIYGAQRFSALLSNSEGAVMFELNKCKTGLDLETDTGKVEYLKRASEILAKIENNAERDVYISRVANEQKIAKTALESDVSAIMTKKRRSDKKKEWKQIISPYKKKDDINPEALLHPKEAKAEEGIIAYLLSNPEKLEDILSSAPTGIFITPFNRRVYSAAAEYLKNGAECSISMFGSEFSADEMGKISEIITNMREIPVDAAAFCDYVSVLSDYRPDSNKPASEMSDDEFAAFFENLKNKK